MSRRSRQNLLLPEDIARAFAGPWGERFPPVLSAKHVMELAGIRRSTLYEWVAKGRFQGAVRKRGKQLLFWRDKVVEILFNGKEWV